MRGDPVSRAFQVSNLIMIATSLHFAAVAMGSEMHISSAFLDKQKHDGLPVAICCACAQIAYWSRMSAQRLILLRGDHRR